MTSIAKKFSLILNGVNVCDLSLDEFGKHTIGLTNTVLAIELPADESG